MGNLPSAGMQFVAALVPGGWIGFSVLEPVMMESSAELDENSLATPMPAMPDIEGHGGLASSTLIYLVFWLGRSFSKTRPGEYPAR